jgi:hypothetical protein
VSVTVVVAGAPGVALDRTLFSLACQEHAPLEVRVAPEAAHTLERYRRLAPKTQWGTTETGVQPYVAFFEAGDTVYPAHFQRLVTALHDSRAAWAMARARWALTDDTVVGEPYCRGKYDVGMDVPTPLLRAGQLVLCAALFHTERLSVPDWSSGPPVQAKLLALALRHPPIALSGLATCETPVRDLPLPTRARSVLKRNLPGVYEMMRSVANRKRR